MSHPIVRFAKPFYDKEEQAAVLEVAKEASRISVKPITNAGRVSQFEEHFADLTGGAAVAVSSCYSALLLCLMARNIGPGDTVIMPALTHIALPQAVEMLGAKCSFVDSHIDDGNMDPDLITCVPGSRLLSVTHFLGKPAYMKSTETIAKRYGMEILEDCALAVGSVHSGRHVGTIGFAGCFSFYPCKHITTAEGGMIVTHDFDLAEKFKRMRSFGYGADRDAGSTMDGGNFRMTEFAAALGLAQLKKLPVILDRRRHNAALLKQLLADFHPIGDHYAISVFVPDKIDRDELRKTLLQDRRIETSVYYPKVIYKHPRFSHYRGFCPVAERISEETITLSVGPHLTLDHMQAQARIFKDCVAQMRKSNAYCAHRRGRIRGASPSPQVA